MRRVDSSVAVELRGFRFVVRRTILSGQETVLNWEGPGPLVVDRSPQLFFFVNDFLHGDWSFLSRLSEEERRALLREANFYGIERLENLLTQWRWLSEHCGAAVSEERGRGFAKSTTSGWDCCVRGEAGMKTHLWRVRICNQKCMVGISRKSICSSDHWQNSEAVVLSCSENAVRGAGEPGHAFESPVQPGEVVTVSLDYGKLQFGRGEDVWSEAVLVGEGEWYPYAAVYAKGGRIELV